LQSTFGALYLYQYNSPRWINEQSQRMVSEYNFFMEINFIMETQQKLCCLFQIHDVHYQNRSPNGDILVLC